MSSVARRPPHLSWKAISLVASGGTVGASAREGLSLLAPGEGRLALTIIVINVVGAFFLGFLYEAVTRDGVSEDHRRRLRLLVGTGFCGGFTTYSTLATQTVLLTDHGHPVHAVLYAATTLILGATATWAGIVLGTWTTGRVVSDDHQ